MRVRLVELSKRFCVLGYPFPIPSQVGNSKSLIISAPQNHQTPRFLSGSLFSTDLPITHISNSRSSILHFQLDGARDIIARESSSASRQNFQLRVCRNTLQI